MSVERRLGNFAAPGEAEAAERARSVATGAFAARAPTRRRAGPVLAFAAAAAVAAVTAAVALTPPGEAVADWVRDLVRSDEPTAGRAAALTALPGEGRLLVTGPGGAWVVSSSGSTRRLGPYESATWSPRGLFAGVTRGRTLLAVEPDGTVRWTLARGEPLSQPAWAPSGYRVAYRAGHSIRVVAGDGSGDRLLVRAAGPAAPAWRHDRGRHLLALATPSGAVELREADTGRRLWRTAPGAAPTALVWVPRSLAVLRGDRIDLLASDGKVRRTIRLPGRAVSAAIRPGRTDLAVSVAGADGTGRVLLVRVRGTPPPHRTLLASPGRIGEVAFSPDGLTVLASRPGAGEWVFLPVEAGLARAVAGIPVHFDPRAAKPRGMPAVRGWVR